MMGLSDGEIKCEDTYNRLDRIPACDRRKNGQTSCHGIVRAMHTRRALIIVAGTWRVRPTSHK